MQRQIVQQHFRVMNAPATTASAPTYPIQVCLPPPTTEAVGPTTFMSNSRVATTVVDPFASPFPSSTSQASSTANWADTSTPVTTGSNPFDDLFLTSNIALAPSGGRWLDQSGRAECRERGWKYV